MEIFPTVCYSDKYCYRSVCYFFFIILSDLRKEEKIKVKLQQSVQENEDLLEMRKRIILTVSHDIRGPLGNIHNCADLASQTREKRNANHIWRIYAIPVIISCIWLMI